VPEQELKASIRSYGHFHILSSPTDRINPCAAQSVQEPTEELNSLPQQPPGRSTCHSLLRQGSVLTFLGIVTSSHNRVPVLQIFSRSHKLSDINDDYWDVRAEPVPEEELNPSATSRTIHVYHISPPGASVRPCLSILITTQHTEQSSAWHGSVRENSHSSA